MTDTAPASTSTPGGPYALAIGTFDGVHLGHQEVLRRTVEAARLRGLVPAALTFVPHPRSVVHGVKEIPYLMQLEERTRRIRELGVAEVRVQRFDAALAALTAREFFERLGEELPLRHLVVGKDFRIGRGREAGVAELRLLGAELGWSMEDVPAVWVEGAPVSSTRIREALAGEGNVELAARLLNRPFELSGTVVEGFGRGRTIGVPTANVRLPDEILVPRNGVYFCSATAALQPEPDLYGVLNIGIRPTFDSGTRSVELHILDWSGDLYGETLRVRFLRRLREERKFESVDALVRQIARDIVEARSLISGQHQPL